MDRAEIIARAHRYLDGEDDLLFSDADQLWRQLKKQDEFTLARLALGRLRAGVGLLDSIPDRRLHFLCQQHALLTSKDPALPAVARHDLALSILGERFDLDDSAMDDDAETLSIAGGIHRRRWVDLGHSEDRERSARYFARAASGPLGSDAYTQINAAFEEDHFAAAGDQPESRRARADEIRRRILDELSPEPDNWWNVATRAEALLGLGRHAEALDAIRIASRPEPWELHTTARQLATLARWRADGPPEQDPELKAFFETLLGGSADAVTSVFLGKVGLALSGGGFRAAFFHLGLLARLAELDVLRHLEVISGVSGGSVVAACYWLALRRRLLESHPIDYLDLVRELMDHLETAVAIDLRRRAQPSRLAMAWRFFRGRRGAMSPQVVARLLERHFFRPLLPGSGPLYLDELPFQPRDHDPSKAGGDDFRPELHNWIRRHKVPDLLLTCTVANNGQMWVFTPSWMGELEARFAEGSARAERLGSTSYSPDVRWPLGLAVAASCCVPLAFDPVEARVGPSALPLIGPRGASQERTLLLADGGIYDNTGARALLARSCDVLLVSDAAGTVGLLGEGASGVVPYSRQAVDTLLERVRQGVRAELRLIQGEGQLRALVYVDLKKDLDPSLVELGAASRGGVSLPFQKALAEVRTDLDAFELDEARSLMACGYQMAKRELEAVADDLGGLADRPKSASWPFDGHLETIASGPVMTPRGEALLRVLRRGRTGE